MYKYTIDAYTLDDFGKPHDVIQLVVTAIDRDSAITDAQSIEKRGQYKIVRVEKLSGDFTTMMGTQKMPPLTVKMDDQTRKNLQKG